MRLGIIALTFFTLATSGRAQSPAPAKVFKRFNLPCLAPLLENYDAEAPKSAAKAFLEGPFAFPGPATDGFGTAHFPITTTSPEAQESFDRGIARLHLLDDQGAERLFRYVKELDPDCAMAYWGLAMANETRPGRARLFIELARRKLSPETTRREQRWIDLAFAFFLPEEALNQGLIKNVAATPLKNDLASLSAARIRALENLIIDFPDDPEATAFLLRQLTLDEHRAGLEITSHLAVESLAREIAAAAPDHPSRHYAIFLWLRERPDRSLESADLSLEIAPAFADNWRYAAQAFAASRRFTEAIAYSEAALRVDHRLLRDRLAGASAAQNYVANAAAHINLLASGGRIERAIEACEALIAMPRETFPDTNRAYEVYRAGSFVTGKTLYAETLMRAELWEQLLEDLGGAPSLAPLEGEFDDQARTHYFRGIALAHLERLDEAEAAAAAIDELQRQAVSAKVGGGIEKEIYHCGRSLRNYLGLFTGASKRLLVKADDRLYLSPDHVARLYDRACLTDQALQLAASELSTRPLHVLNIATHADLQARNGQTGAAMTFFDRIFRTEAHRADPDLPLLDRITELATSINLPSSWTLGTKAPVPPALPASPDDELGPRHWSPPPAPGFSLPDHAGREHSLADFKGKPVLLNFFLGISCAFCVEQLELFKPHLPAFEEAGIEFFAVSTDGREVLEHAFGSDPEKQGDLAEAFPFPIVADPELSIFGAYGAVDQFEAGALHATFLVDGEGKILWSHRSHAAFRQPEALLREARRLLDLHRPR